MARFLAVFGLVPMDLPAVNATLNALAAVLLVAAFLAVRARRYRLHMGLMLAAFLTSVTFLGLYLYFHFVVKDGKPTRFPVHGGPAMVYYTVLLTHTVLAVVVAIAAPWTLLMGFNAFRNSHKWVARWTLPIWLYVSVTGVVVYWMLYRLYPPA
jgi:uncharacterized membrane protein YozB (DUF420 family)